MISPISRVKTNPLADSTSSVNIIPQRVLGAKRSLKDAETSGLNGSKKKSTIVSERKTLVERAIAPRKASAGSSRSVVEENSKSVSAYPKTGVAGLSRSLNGGHVRSASALGGNLSNTMLNSQTMQRPGAKTLGDRPKRPAWDTRGRLEDMEIAYSELKEQISIGNTEKDAIITVLENERHKCECIFFFTAVFHGN